MSSDAVDATPISYDLVELSEDDQIKEQEELIKELDEPDTLTNFVKACKNIGKTAVNIDNDFLSVKYGFDELVEKYGKDFPKVKSDFLPRWEGFMARWTGQSGLLWSSKKLAGKTAATLTDYGINLQLVADIANVKELKDAQAELKDYVAKNPVEIATTVADGFKDLRNDIAKFSLDFSKYLEDEGKRLSEEAQKYEDEIKKYEAEVESLNGKIKDTLIALACTAVFGISLLITVGFLAKYISDRKEAQKNLDNARNNLEQVKKKQNALAAMQADFEILKPLVDNICSNLGIFAMIWAFMTEQSIEIDSALNGGIETITTKKFQKKLELLRKQIVPLIEGMRAYAAIVTFYELESKSKV